MMVINKQSLYLNSAYYINALVIQLGNVFVGDHYYLFWTTQTIVELGEYE